MYNVQHGRGERVTRPPSLPPLPSPVSVEDPADLFDSDVGSTASATTDSAAPSGGPSPTPALPPARPFRPGCYLLRWTPSPVTTYPDGTTLHYDGTLRVQPTTGEPIISGDFYVHPWEAWQVEEPDPSLPPPGGAVPHVVGHATNGDSTIGIGTNGGSSSGQGTRTEPNPADGIPVFPIAHYRHYVRGVRIVPTLEPQTRLILVLDIHRWQPEDATWHPEGFFSADMRWTLAPLGFPGTADYLEGVLRDGGGTAVGEITMGWVSPSLRRAVLEIDTVAESEAPEDNGSGLDWKAAFADVGWDLSVEKSHLAVTEPNQSGAWSNTELHREMLRWRDGVDHDTSWRFHLFCVRRLTATERGIMYDAFAGDSNNIPREGAAIASHWSAPDTAKWGHARGKRAGAFPPVYFRTAVHEMGHAMGLYHNTSDFGFMNTTDVIAASASTTKPFPDNVQWGFSDDDAHRLRHMPDLRVRPGGVPFGRSYGSAPIVAADRLGEVPGMVLGVSSLLDSVPLGAPVRIDLEMVNTCAVARPGPSTLSLKSGHVTGRVIDPAGVIRTFRPLVLCFEEAPGERTYAPQECMQHSMTLLRGAQGALFPTAGSYRIEVETAWEIDGAEVSTTGATDVMITPPESPEHAKTAKYILNSPDALLSLVLGGNHLPSGAAAIHAGAEDAVLGPHYAIIEAKRLAKDPDAGLAAMKTAMDLLNERAVLSGAEMKRAAELVAKAVVTRGSITRGRAVARRIKSRVSDVLASPEVHRIIKAL